MDVTEGPAVFIRQLGEAHYEIGLAGAPAAVAAIEVVVDGFPLRDEETGLERSPRLAISSHFHQLGLRRFELSTFGHDGAWRGTLRREMDLE